MWMRVHHLLLKPAKEYEEESRVPEQQGYMGPPSKFSLGPSWASVSDLTLDGVLVDWHPQVTAFLPCSTM